MKSGVVARTIHRLYSSLIQWDIYALHNGVVNEKLPPISTGFTTLFQVLPLVISHDAKLMTVWPMKNRAAVFGCPTTSVISGALLEKRPKSSQSATHASHVSFLCIGLSVDPTATTSIEI